MTNHKAKKMSKQLVRIMPVLFLALAIIQTAQTTQFTQAQATSSPWALKLQILNGQNTTATVFNPFSLVQLCANVTYDNSSQPDVLVSFQVTGPSAEPITISRIEETGANGLAAFSFRLPMEAQDEDSIIGTWNATATINGANPQSASFTTQWSLQTTSISLLNTQGQNQTVFAPGSNAGVQVAISNQGAAQQANVTVSMQDSTNQIINQTEILNSQIPSSNQTSVQATLQIPDNAVAGQAAVNVAIYEGTYNGTDIPAAENQTAYFTIGTGTITITPTPTPSVTPTPGPTPTPIALQNTVTLFSWLLVATGLFTFTLLTAFLRRKAIGNTGLQTPNLPIATSEAPSLDTSTTQQPPPTARVAPGNMASATMTTQAPAIYETWLSQTPFNADAPNKPDSKPPTYLESPQAIAAYLSKISETGQKVQALEASLKIEREQLNKEIMTLNRVLEEQEQAVKNYFDSIRQAVATAITAQPVESNGKSDTQAKQTYNEQDPPPAEVNEKPDASAAEIITKPNLPTPEANNEPNPPAEVIENPKTPPVEIAPKPYTLTVEVNNNPNPPTAQSGEAKKAKEPQRKIRRGERTEAEDIRIAEHTRED